MWWTSWPNLSYPCLTLADPRMLQLQYSLRVEEALWEVSTCFWQEEPSNFLMDAGANTCLLGHRELVPRIAVLPPSTRKIPTLLLVHMDPIYVRKITWSCSETLTVKKESYINCWTHVMATHLAEISTKQKSIEEVYASISSRISPGQGTAFSWTSKALWEGHLLNKGVD